MGRVDFSMSIGKPGQAGSPEVKGHRKTVIETAVRMACAPRRDRQPGAGAVLPGPGRAPLLHRLGSVDPGQWWKTNGEKMRKILETV